MKFYPATALTISAMGLAASINSGHMSGIIAGSVAIGGLAAIELLEFVQQIRQCRQNEADIELGLSAPAFDQEGDRVHPTVITEHRSLPDSKQPAPSKSPFRPFSHH